MSDADARATAASARTHRRSGCSAGPDAPAAVAAGSVAAALLVAALAAVAGVKLVTVGWLSNSGVDAYERSDYGAAEVAFDRLSIANVVQRWVAPFDLGVARAANDDLTGAESAFRTALRLDPARCETRFNLAATIEAIGDDVQGGALNPVARQRYEDALAIAEAGACDPEIGARAPPGPAHRPAASEAEPGRRQQRPGDVGRQRPPLGSAARGRLRPVRVEQPVGPDRATEHGRRVRAARPSGDDHAGTGEPRPDTLVSAAPRRLFSDPA